MTWRRPDRGAVAVPRLRAWLVFQVEESERHPGPYTRVLNFTPYYHWRWKHALHHASAGNLDGRGAGEPTR
ncbi:MAG TPA: hypothetical protein VG146_04250 [Verrucomicrobiae bacterium]|nr:hypothetical protein [Verrucomicrobiae bacterium]